MILLEFFILRGESRRLYCASLNPWLRIAYLGSSSYALLVVHDDHHHENLLSLAPPPPD